MLYKWKCTHPTLGEVEIIAADKLRARIGAAEFWHQPWTNIVYATEATCVGEAPVMEPPAEETKPKKTTRKKKETAE